MAYIPISGPDAMGGNGGHSQKIGSLERQQHHFGATGWQDSVAEVRTIRSSSRENRAADKTAV